MVQHAMQVAAFTSFTQQFEERMCTSGPGLATVQLPQGLESLKVFQEELEGLGKQREQLRLAEQLFDMDITSYPHLSKVRYVAVPSTVRLKQEPAHTHAAQIFDLEPLMPSSE